MVSPRAAAVFRLIARSNFVGCSTGKSAGSVYYVQQFLREQSRTIVS